MHEANDVIRQKAIQDQIDDNIVPVSESRQCHSCQWAFRVGFSGPFQCRRNPPTVTTFMVPGRIQGQPQIVGHTSFPQVDAPTWCGEFKPRPAIKGAE